MCKTKAVWSVCTYWGLIGFYLVKIMRKFGMVFIVGLATRRLPLQQGQSNYLKKTKTVQRDCNWTCLMMFNILMFMTAFPFTALHRYWYFCQLLLRTVLILYIIQLKECRMWFIASSCSEGSHRHKRLLQWQQTTTLLSC